ncbi:MAG: aminoacyl-tRNA hydrolase [Clostridia bacterium]|nr:aminoacyl-tRNA hydrolase [Clostridia bacterium]
MANIFDLFKKIEKNTPAVQGPVTHLIVGLGNPGAQYANTRHNAGFLALDAIAEKLGVRIDRTRFKALTAEASLGGAHVLLLKPQTFMNLSGEAVREAAAFYHIEPANIIVIYDDINLAVGRLRVRGKGSDGGHNGIKSIIAQLGSNEFPRVRVGVGERPNPAYDLADWVLSAFTPGEREALAASFPAVQAGAELLVKGDLAAAQQRCNGVGAC